MDKPAGRPIPLHLVTFAILSPSNTPLYIHSYTGKQDELRYVQIAHSALDVVEEKGKLITCGPYFSPLGILKKKLTLLLAESMSDSRGLESYLGLLCVMDDLAV